MWTKVLPRRAGHPADPREMFAVMRSMTSNKNAAMIFPHWSHSGHDRVDIYSDGERIAFKLGAKGDYKMRAAGPQSRVRVCTIPADFAHRLPYGTTDAVVTEEGGMFVLDLNQFSTPKALKAAFSRHAQTVAAE